MFRWNGFFAVACVCFILIAVTLDSSDAWWRRRRRRRHVPTVPHDRWQNNWDQPFSFQCPYKQSLSRLRSIHSNHHEDRRWAFSCHYNPYQSGRCHWTHYNKYDHPIKFTCHYNGFVAGVKSHHSNHHEDRQYSFKCCDAARVVVRRCHWTGYRNGWDQQLLYYVPRYYYLRGVKSVHNNHREDRVWGFFVCRH